MAEPATAAFRKRILARYDLNLPHRVISAGSVRTAYLSGGAGKPIVLLHGAGGGCALWAPVLGPLCGQFHTVAVDVAGFGESDKPAAAYDRPFFTDWLRRFLDALALKRVTLLGNSQGGAIALHFAFAHPQRVEKLVLVGSGGLGVRGFSAAVFFSMLAATLVPGRDSLRRLVRYLVHQPDPVADSDLIDYLLAVARSPGARRQFVYGRGRAVKPLPAAELRQIRAPALLVWGDRDRVLSSKNAVRGLRTLPNASLRMINGTGHAPFFEKPREFLRVVLPFLTAC